MSDNQENGEDQRGETGNDGHSELYTTSDQVDREMAPVTVKTRYVWAEKNRQLIEAGLVDPENVNAMGIMRGLGDAPRGGNAGAPEKVYGFSVRHPGMLRKSDDGYRYTDEKTYCSPFKRSFLGEATRNVKIPDPDGGHEVERRVCPARLASFLNESIFLTGLLEPADLEYITARPNIEEYRRGRRPFEGSVDRRQLAATYQLFTRVILLPETGTGASNQEARCILCWRPAYGKCDECDCKVINVNTQTPIECLRPLVKSAHRLFARTTAEHMARKVRQTVKDFRGEETANYVAPDFEKMFGELSEVYEYANESGIVPPDPDSSWERG